MCGALEVQYETLEAQRNGWAKVGWVRNYFPGFVVGFSIAATRLRLMRVTMPFRRYQIPSCVRHTSSAGILDPLIRRIVTGPDLVVLFALVERGLLVETGLELDGLREEGVRTGLSGGDELTSGFGDVWMEADALGSGDTINDGSDDGICCVVAAAPGGAEPCSLAPCP